MKNSTKRILSALLAVNCTAVCIPAFAVNAEDEQKIIYSSDFEDGDISAWSKRGDDDTSELSVSEEKASSGSKSLCVTGRTQSWNGPSFRMDDKCEPDTVYLINTKVAGKWYTDNLTLSWQYDDASGVTHYDNLTKVSGGDWQEIKDFKFSYTSSMKNVCIYFEGGTDDIYIDDFSIKTAPVIHPQSDIVSLKDAYANSFKIGTATTAKELAPTSTKELILKHFNSLTAGNELKPDAILDQKACLALAADGDDTNPQISLDSARSILDFARDNHISVRGHVLVWHQQTPEWFFKENYDASGEWVSKEKMLKRLENYIKNVFTAVKEEYPDVDFYAWDVVNECFQNDGKPREPGFPAQSNNYEFSPWVQIFGDNSFIKPAFEFAKKYAPEGTKLYYNDFNEYMDKKSAIVALTEEINADGHYIDGIGMQSHLDARSGSDAFPSVSQYEQALDLFCNTGLDVQITELDATINSPDLFEEQAKYYSDIMDAIMKHQDKVSAVVFWGTTDDQSWRAPNYPLLFNEDYTAKPAFDAIVDGLEVVPPTEKPTEEKPTETESEPETQDSSEAIESSETTGDILWGDADESGEVDILDVITINKAVLGKETLTETQVKKADVNQNSKPDSSDAMTILKLIVGIIKASDLPLSE